MVIAEQAYTRDIRDVASDYLACSDTERRTQLEAEFIELAYQIIKPVVAAKIPYDERENVAENCVLKILYGIRGGKFRYAEKAAGWISTLARNEVANYYMRNKRYQCEPLDAFERVDSNGYGDPEQEVERRFESSAVRRAVNDLPEAQKEVIALQYFADLHPKDVAIVLGKAENTVKTNARIARGKLRMRLSELRVREDSEHDFEHLMQKALEYIIRHESDYDRELTRLEYRAMSMDLAMRSLRK